MIYEVRLSLEAQQDLYRLAKSEPKAFAKANRFIKVTIPEREQVILNL